MNISVIIPVYNAERFLTKAVDSALQLEGVKEVILIEDNSPDNALEICRELVKKDNRIKLFRHPNGENRGAGASRNLGLQKATQDYIAFLDADDFYLPNRFEKDKEIFEKYPDADGCYNALGAHFYTEEGKYNYIKTFKIKGNPEEYLRVCSKEIAPDKLFDALWTPGISVLIHLDTLTLKRNSLNMVKGGFFKENLRLHQDAEFVIRLTYYLHLYPSQLDKAVAVRGVHDENRITKVVDKKQKMKLQFLMFYELYDWAKKEEIAPHHQNQLLYRKMKLELRSKEGIKVLTCYFKYIFSDSRILIEKMFYPIHKSVLKKIKRKILR